MKIDMEKVIKSLETCSDVYYGATGACSSCSFSQSKNCFAELVHQTIELLKAQRKVIRDLCTLGYPHNFQHEAQWVAQYCRDVSGVITEAFEVNDNDDT